MVADFLRIKFPCIDFNSGDAKRENNTAQVCLKQAGQAVLSRLTPDIKNLEHDCCNNYE